MTMIVRKGAGVSKFGGVYQLLGGQIPEMVKGGATLQEIADKGGVTRERIRQIIKKHYPDIMSDYISESKLLRILDMSYKAFRSFGKSKNIVPDKIVSDNSTHLYLKSRIKSIKKLVTKHCKICRTVIKSIRKTYCAECAPKIRRNHYKYSTKKQRVKHQRATKNWQRQHPKQYKIILDKAKIKYKAKVELIYFANTEYEVCKNGYLPIGTIFKAIGCENRHLILDDGSKIPNSVVRIKKSE